jgi:crotonobetainyl-CoA:carnitine CoA-transferase CaiB-like acyl-CoA transferase
MRDATGVGGRVSTSLFEVGAAFMAYDLAAFQLTGRLPEPRGSGHPAFAPYGLFRAQDGYLAIGVGADRIFARLARVLGAEAWIEDERFATNAARVAHREELRAAIEERLQSQTLSAWLPRLSEAGVPADRLADVADLLADGQLAAIDCWLEEELPDSGDGRTVLKQPGLPIRFSQQRPPIRIGSPPLGRRSSHGEVQR